MDSFNGISPLNNIFGALFGQPKKTEPEPDPVPQAPISYDRMGAILNSGILKNPNASMTPVAKPPVQTPAPTPQQKPKTFIDLLFGSMMAGTPFFGRNDGTVDPDNPWGSIAQYMKSGNDGGS